MSDEKFIMMITIMCVVAWLVTMLLTDWGGYFG